MPSKEEIEIHNATHIPFRNWCAFCVAGKAQSDPHFIKKEVTTPEQNVVSMDYAFLSKKVNKSDRESEEVESDADDEDVANEPSNPVLKVLVLRDRRTKYCTSSVVPRKGDHPYAVHRVGQDLTCILGYKRCFVKTDQERAIRKLKSAVRMEYDIEIPDELAPVGDSQSNGEIEITVKIVEGQIRTLKCQLEHHLKQEIPVDHPLLPWLVRHAGATISRYQKGRDGMTAYRRLKGRDFVRNVIEFGECVWYMRNKNNKKGKLESNWEPGVFLGIREESSEAVIGTPDGVVKARSFRRKGSEETRWDKDNILAVQGLPWQPDPKIQTYDIRSRVGVRVEQPSEVQVGETREFVSRRFKILKKDLKDHGYTIGCAGCMASRKGATANHSEECRARIATALAAVADPRIVKAVENMLGDTIDPSEILPEEVIMPENAVLISEEPDNMSVSPPSDIVDAALEGELYELTADPYIAHKVAKWERGVTKQWWGKRWSDGVHEMNSLMSERDIQTHVSEIYSPPRVTGLASGLGLIPGMALDLSTVDPDDGKAWDFNNPEKEKSAT